MKDRAYVLVPMLAFGFVGLLLGAAGMWYYLVLG
jgi:hypothetical protein